MVLDGGPESLRVWLVFWSCIPLDPFQNIGARLRQLGVPRTGEPDRNLVSGPRVPELGMALCLFRKGQGPAKSDVLLQRHSLEVYMHP